MAYSESTIQVPHHIRHNQTVGAGLSSWVHRLDAVAKCYGSTETQARAREMAVYQRLGSDDEDGWPRGIMRFYGVLDEQSVVLQFAPHGSVRQFLGTGQPACLATRLGWAEQAAAAIAFLHSKRVLHCDISCNNMFLDGQLDVVVGDFAGSSLDGAPCLSWYETSHSHPDMMEPSPQSEMFALGSTFYEMLVGRPPYQGLGPLEVQESFRDGRFPSLEALPALQGVIAKCWRQEYQTVDELSQDIKKNGNLSLHYCKLS